MDEHQAQREHEVWIEAFRMKYRDGLDIDKAIEHAKRALQAYRGRFGSAAE